MLSASHNRAYQDFLTLLTEFTQVVGTAEQSEITPRYKHGACSDRWSDSVKPVSIEFNQLSAYFQEQVTTISDRQIEPELASRWQSVQTEILREFKLLSTDVLFLASARQDSTKQKRLNSIKLRLDKLSNYCQIILEDNN